MSIGVLGAINTSSGSALRAKPKYTPLTKPNFNLPQWLGVVGRGHVRLQSGTSAERRKMTVFQGIFQSEGTRDGRGPQPHVAPAGRTDRSHAVTYPESLSLSKYFQAPCSSRGAANHLVP